MVVLAPSANPRITVIIPTFNEIGNIAPLTQAIKAALNDITFEILFADDSTDTTTDIIRQLASNDKRIKFRHRCHAKGLASAVVEALPEASADFIAVMDGDFQHPPAILPKLLERAERQHGDIVIASRYITGGDAYGLSSPARHIGSQIGRFLAYVMAPRSRVTTDPLSGFFIVKRTILDGIEWQPIGFKVLLEIIVRSRPSRVLDIPFHFQQRAEAKSKASIRQLIDYARHLVRLRY